MQFEFVMNVAILLEGVVETSAVRGMCDGVGVEVVVFCECGPCFEDTRSGVDERANWDAASIKGEREMKRGYSTDPSMSKRI